MSSRFTKLFKPNRSASRRDTGIFKDSDNFSLSVASVSSNSTELATTNEQSASKDAKHSKDSSNSSLLTNSNTETPGISTKNDSSASVGGSNILVPTNANKQAKNPVSMGSSVVVDKRFANNATPFSTSAVNGSSETPVLKFSDAQIKLLKWSWNENISLPKDKENNPIETSVKVNSLSEIFASSQFWNEIYSNVYLVDPGLKKMLPTPEHQTVFFTGIIRMAVLNVADLTVMNEYLRSIGRRHGILFGAEPDYFQSLGIAIIRSLNDRLGEDFTPELEQVWILLYCYISNTMIESCSVDPILPEEVLLGMVASPADKDNSRFLIEDDHRNGLSKKKSMINTQSYLMTQRHAFI